MNVDTSTLRNALPHHEVGGELGRGRFGVVVAARHKSLGRDDAIRFLSGATAADALPGLDHPHLVRVYNRVDYDGGQLVVMERLRGGTLRARSAPTLATCCAVVLGLAAGLAHAHDRGVVHGDLRICDVLFTADGTPKLADVGLTDLRSSWGGGSPADDVRALAAVLYELLTGRPPHGTDELSETQHYPPDLPGVPAAIADVVQRTLAVDPTRRPISAREFALELASAVAPAMEPGWLDGAAGTLVFLEPPIRAVATSHPSNQPAGPPRPRVDLGALNADVRGDPTTGLWVQPARRKRRRRALGTFLAVATITAVAAAAALLAPRFTGSGSTATVAPDPAGSSVPASAAAGAETETEPEPETSNATAGPVFADVAERGTVGGLSRDGRRLALLDLDGVVTTYDTSTGETVARVVGPPMTGEATEIAFSPDGTVVAYATTASLVLGGRDVTGAAGLGGATFGGLEFLDGGTSVVVVEASRLAVFDTASGNLVHEVARTSAQPGAAQPGAAQPGAAQPVPGGPPTPLGPAALDVVADPRGVLLAVVTPSAVEFWDRATGTQVATVPTADGARRFAAAAAWRPDGTLLTCLADGDGRTTRYEPVVVDPAGGGLTPLAEPAAGSLTGLGRCAFDADGSRLAARADPAGDDVVVWDLDASAELARVAVPAGPLSTLGLSGDGRTLAVSSGQDVRVWSLPAAGQ